MDELIRWTDGDSLGRRYEISFDGTRPFSFKVRVWAAGLDTCFGEGEGHSLNFAAVKALINFGNSLANLAVGEP